MSKQSHKKRDRHFLETIHVSLAWILSCGFFVAAVYRMFDDFFVSSYFLALTIVACPKSPLPNDVRILAGFCAFVFGQWAGFFDL